MTRGRRIAVAGVIVLATILLMVAVLSTFVRRQALDTNNWTNTSSQILESKHVQAALGAYLVDQLFSNIDVAGDLRAQLPTQLQGLAGPAAGGLRQVADRAAPQLLARPRVQDAWRLANRNAHKQFLRILNGGGPVVKTNNGVVALDLHALVSQLGGNVGLADKVNSALPASAGTLVIMKADQLKTAQNVAKGLRHLSIISTVLAFVLYGLAIFLARGRRRIELRTTGWCFFGAGLSFLLVRRMGGNWIVDGLVRSDAVKPAAHDAWNIGTGLLRAIALAFVIYGLLIVLAAWLAGPSRPARAVRRALAPSMRDHPWRVYAGVGLAYLLVLVWGPTPAFRHIVPILIVAALLVLGIELLRRQTAREFPEARAGDATANLKAWWAARRGHPVAEAGNGHIKDLERLAYLHDTGALTDEEYATQKGLLLQA